IATDTAVQLKPYLRQHYPQARGIFLTVNLRNVGARDIYLRGGFNDTGEQYLEGGAGPQHILYLPLIT
ncbi:MAG: GNAT family N-acetyltransferase, partial [Paracoccaceae bacterium]